MNYFIASLFRPCFLPCFLLLLAGCESSDAPAPPRVVVVETLDRHADQALAPALEHWRDALRAFDQDLSEPTQEALPTLEALREAWRALYVTVNRHWLALATRACARDEMATLARLDAWPLYPAYVDGVPDWPESGIVHDPALPIRPDTLLQQQNPDSAGEISLGFQVVWLLINGMESRPRDARSFTEEADAGQRRRDYLRVAGALLGDTVESLLEADGVTVGELLCAMRSLDHRLAEARRQSKRSMSAGELYVPEESLAILTRQQPEAALEQLAAEEVAPLRAALEKHTPGFNEALERARENQDWAPLSVWLKQ